MFTLLAYALCFGSVATAGLAVYPQVSDRAAQYFRRQARDAAGQLEQMFVLLPSQRVWLLHALAPPVMGVLAWMLSGLWAMGLVGLAIGLVLPKLLMRHLVRVRTKTFHAQLIDGLLLLSSCLRAGLSLMQSLAVLAEEMPPPISQEFGLVLKETRMGINLDEAMMHARDRMPSDDMHLFVTAVLVARESGGDITAIFTQLVETLRERKKVRERIKTLTFMARLQGGLMAALPLVFAYSTYTMNHEHFAYFLNNPTGKGLLMLVGLLEVIAAGLFLRFSRSPM